MVSSNYHPGVQPLGQEYLICGVGAYIWGTLITQFVMSEPTFGALS